MNEGKESKLKVITKNKFEFIHTYFSIIGRFIQGIEIKKKVIISLIFMCIISIVSVSVVNILISSGVITENSQDMVNDIILQISYSLDDRISQFENDTYSLVTSNSVSKMVDTKNTDSHFTLSTNFSDFILQNSDLYKYTDIAVIQVSNGEQYIYSKVRQNENRDEETQRILKICKQKVNKIKPTAWVRNGNSVYFVRLIVNSSTYQVKGILCVRMQPSFFEIISKNREVFSNNNLIVINSNNDVMYNDGYDLKDDNLSVVMGKKSTNQIHNYRIKYNKDDCIVTDTRTSQKKWRILGIVKISVLLQKNKTIMFYVFLIAIIVIIFSVLITYFIAKGITKNIKIIEKAMSSVEKGDFKTRIKPAAYDDIGMLGLRFNYFIIKMENLIDTISKEINKKQQAEFQALEAQINPHFLYNTLGSIKWYANSQNQPYIEKMLDSLILLLKSSIKRANDYQTVDEEIKLIESYINLQKMRFGDAFRVEYLIEESIRSYSMLSFLLQPLVENSLYHGLDMDTNSGVIWIRAFKRNNSLILQVEDNGCGFPQEKLGEIMTQPKKYKGFNSIGVKIVSDRLKAYYGNRCDLHIESELGMGTLVEIELPLERRTFKKREQDESKGTDC